MWRLGFNGFLNVSPGRFINFNDSEEFFEPEEGGIFLDVEACEFAEVALEMRLEEEHVIISAGHLFGRELAVEVELFVEVMLLDFVGFDDDRGCRGVKVVGVL